MALQDSLQHLYRAATVSERMVGLVNSFPSPLDHWRQPLAYSRGSVLLALLALLACSLHAGPVEFGKAELDRALAERHMTLSYRSGVSQLPPEAFEIEPFRITGGDLR